MFFGVLLQISFPWPQSSTNLLRPPAANETTDSFWGTNLADQTEELISVGKNGLWPVAFAIGILSPVNCCQEVFDGASPGVLFQFPESVRRISPKKLPIGLSTAFVEGVQRHSAPPGYFCHKSYPGADDIDALQAFNGALDPRRSRGFGDLNHTNSSLPSNGLKL